jgi:hypothetical protein
MSTPNLAEILDQSRVHFADRKYADVLKTVAPIDSEGAGAENAAMEELAQLGAWSAYQIGKFAKADEYLESLSNRKGLGESETVLKGLLHYEFREYAECIKTAEPILMPLSDTARADEREVASRAQRENLTLHDRQERREIARAMP